MSQLRARLSDEMRLRVRVRGVVQGVGFRPHVFALARRLELSGFVQNDEAGVLIEVEGQARRRFVALLLRDPPPLARIDQVQVEPTPSLGEADFEIRHSEQAGAVSTSVPADVSTCPACLEEIFEPTERRYRYPFTNCTHCGPRFTITSALPYDRANTSMAPFTMCPECEREYRDPADRRFHAQPIACPSCGPVLSEPIDAIVQALRAGEIVALKGLGGYHLACDARNLIAVETLRARKRRDGKPFALMVANLASARRLVELDEDEAALLAHRTRPIVIARRRTDSGLAEGIAPGLDWLGVMLPYTPLHHLLFHEAAGRPNGTGWLAEAQALALVMTSANESGEPLVIDDEVARRELAELADRVVTHSRRILIRADDSVARVQAGGPVFLRRARGYCPEGLALGFEAPPILAMGAELKSTFCLTRGSEAFLSQHIGDLGNPGTSSAFDEALDHALHLVGTRPELVVHDLHPDFVSTQKAHSLGLPTLAVQHHHAHVAAVLAEHRVDEPVIGLALDGYGYGVDGSAWGGELLRVEGARCERLGHFAPLPMPGGDKAAEEPWRMAAAILHGLDRWDLAEARFADLAPLSTLRTMLDRRVRSPLSTAAGRWFDAAAGLLGLLTHHRFEGEGPMRLESLVHSPRVLEDGYRIEDGVLSLWPLMEALIGRPADEGAELFHGTLGAAIFDWGSEALDASALTTVVIGGGCAANRVLVEDLISRFSTRGVRVLIARAVPPNDGGLCLGQAWVAAKHLEA